jgi:ubiquinone/menaquinone biosynthesis C-methylase UbiE
MFLTPRRRNGPELLDMPEGHYTFEELEGSLSDIRSVNRYLGDTRAVLVYLDKLADAMSFRAAGRAISILDVATGSADIPVSIAGWARQNGINVRVTAVDVNPLVVEAARKNTASYPEITLAVADGLALPFADSSFDFVICAKTLHHFTEEAAGSMVREIKRVGAKGYMFIDIRRSWVAFALIYLLTRLLTRNRLTRNDGPLSVLRSFTDDEMARIARLAGLDGFRVVRLPFFRVAIVGGF